MNPLSDEVVTLAGVRDPGWGRPLAPGELPAVAGALGAVLARVHAAPVTPTTEVVAALRARCLTALGAAADAALDAGSEGAALLELVASRAVEPDRQARVHGALGPDRIRVGPDGSVGLTGWGSARTDDPWADLAAVCLLPATVRDAFARGYGPMPAPGPRLDAQVAGVLADHLGRAGAPELSPWERIGQLAVFRALSRALVAGRAGGPPSRGAVRGEWLLARLVSEPTLDAGAAADFCVAASFLRVGPFDAWAATAPIGPAAADSPEPGDWLGAVFADPLRPGVDLRLPFALAVLRAADAAGTMPDRARRRAAALVSVVAVAGPEDAATTVLYGTLARGALGALATLVPDRAAELLSAREHVDDRLDAALGELGVRGWRAAGWAAADPAGLIAAAGSTALPRLVPLVADAVASGAEAAPQAALLRVLGAPLQVALGPG